MSGLPDTTICEADRAATLHAVFVADEQPAFLGLYTGASCTLPTGEVVEVSHRPTPFFCLWRELDARGCGSHRIEISTPTGTASMRAVVRVAAGSAVKERDRGGLRLERFQEFPGLTTDSQVELEGTSGGQKRLIALLDRTAPPARRHDFYTASLCSKVRHTALTQHGYGGPESVPKLVP